MAGNSLQRKDRKMKRFKNFLLDANTKREAAYRLKRYGAAFSMILIAGLIFILSVQAKGHPEPFRFELAAASDTITACLPHAAGTVTVLPREDRQGVDTLDLKAEGLPAHTTFTVFLTELAAAPFGAAEYIGELTTNAGGRGSVRVDSVIEEAFSTTVVDGARVRKDLNHVVLWFADPAADDFCFTPQTGPITGFDGDGEAGGTALSSRNFLPGAPLP
jgi:hypothetical protein